MRSAIIVVLSAALAVIGLVSFRPQSFGKFVGSNGALKTVQIAPQGNEADAPGQEGSATQSRSVDGVDRSSRSSERDGESGTDADTGSANGQSLSAGSSGGSTAAGVPKRCTVTVNGKTVQVPTRNGRTAEIRLTPTDVLKLTCKRSVGAKASTPARTP